MTAVGARELESLEEAQDHIVELIQDCEDGISNRESEPWKLLKLGTLTKTGL